MIWSRTEKGDCAELLTIVNFLYLIFCIEIIRILDEMLYGKGNRQYIDLMVFGYLSK
jgi:hypothetical protein